MFTVEWENTRAICCFCGETFNSINTLTLVVIGPTIVRRPKYLCCEECLLDLESTIRQGCCVTTKVEDKPKRKKE